MEIKGVNVVVLGGGTGSFMVLSGLKNYVNHITAIVNMVDDGGSTGKLRDELGVLPPGDIRQCLVALSDSSEAIRDLFSYRFEEGTLAGHSFGNLLLTALEKTTGSFADAVRTAGEVLNITGEVIPVTLEDVRLALAYEDGEMVNQESVIDHLNVDHDRAPRVFTKPAASINPQARRAIERADMVVIAPGTLYTSTLPLLAIDGVAEALSTNDAKVVYVCNLTTNHGQTDGFRVADFSAELERYLPEATLDYVVYNNQSPTRSLLDEYKKEGEQYVEADEVRLSEASYEPIGVSLLSQPASEQGLIRHDADKLARSLMRIYFN